jgi:U4/U6 small nuclear ribonucleoprotein PRP31
MEATSTLADALLDDLDELSDAPNEDEDVHDEAIFAGEQNSKRVVADHDDDRDGEVLSSTDWWPKHQKQRLLEDSNLQQHVAMVRAKMQNGYKSDANRHDDIQSSNDPELDHQLLVKSNQCLIAIANDLETAHTCLCKAYEPHFPELEELLPDAVQYLRAVRTIGNETDFTSRAVNDGLNTFLTSHQIITLSVAGSTTAGRLLTEEEMHKVDQIASYMEQVMEIRQLLTEYIEQQMEGLAPSICALVGAGTAAKLISLTGGLANLSKIPSCNLQVIGQSKHTRGSAASSSVTRTPHQGILTECDLVQRCPRHMRSKALKLVAAKLALAIRCDFVNVDTGRPRTADPGRAFREQIEQKFAQLQEPDKAPVLKALPK